MISQMMAIHYPERLHSLTSIMSTTFAFDTERVIKRTQLGYEAGLSPDGVNRQLAAIIASGSRKEALKSVQVPTLVIHGDEDPLLRVEGGIDTAEAIPGAELMIIPGMGHALPMGTWPQIVSAIRRHARV